MRTKVLSANQRIKIGKQEGPMISGAELHMLARVLQTVGLTLEVVPSEQANNRVLLYAARRVATNDIAVPSQVKPIAKAGAA